MYDKECSGVTTMPFYRSMYDRSTGQSPNMPREQVSINSFSFSSLLHGEEASV
jgi:hypothetical protein